MAPSKALILTFTLATVCFISFFFIDNLSTISINELSSDFCSSSLNSISCHEIITEASLYSSSSQQIFQTIITKSLEQLNTAVTTAVHISRRNIDPSQKSPLDDCILLLDLSRDRLAMSASAVADGDSTNARTWLSAVLTNHGTCLDDLNGSVRSSMEKHIQPLRTQTSTLLAMLNSFSPSKTDELTKLIKEFPTWVSHYDRKLLEASSAKDVQANVVVAKDGSGKFKTVKEAVDSSPDNGKSRYVIYVKKGVYKENVSIGKKKLNLMIVGDGMDATVITGSLNVVDGATTFNSATLATVGDGLILQDLKIENTAGPQKHQAVALRVSADRSIINRCRLDAYQDTLYSHSLRQFYRDSTVTGTVDFIFGNSAVVFQNCDLVARKPMDKQQNLVTAQGREDPNQNTGTSIQACRIIPSSDLIPVKTTFPTYLGRPWKAYSRTVFMQSYIDDHVDPKGWLEWDGDFALKTLFYGEYQNKGPGAGTSGRVKWPGYHVITDSNVAKSFTVGVLIQGGSWIKGTGVVFTEGL
ncbi:hypothetical protein LUZ60_007556 [Juncus effusus]|nr:hypothetical protein LUZ60_007556 [Juncus effusus]